MPRRTVLWAVLVSALVVLAGPRPLAAQSAYEELQTFSGVLNYIRLNYADSVTYAALVRAAIDGMLRSLDPHSYFQTRRDWEQARAFERGELVGPGVELEWEDSAATVVSVAPDGSAAKAGIEPGDRLAAIADTSVAGLKLEEVVLRLAGPKGSKVRVKLERGLRLEPETLTVTLKRQPLKVPPVVLTGMADPVTGYLGLIWFGPKAGEEVHDALKRLTRQGARQVILDLRGNPGGVVDAAVDIASDLLPNATVVFRTRGRKPDASRDYVTQHDGAFRDLPLVVLINRQSASASEALAGSLQDHDRALILGRRSFGKALVQTGFLVLPAGDLVQLTIARVFTPSGRLIQRRYQGIGYEQYLSFAGKSGAAEDTLAVFRTDHGRTVRGGGGIAPDVVLPAPAALPVWWSVARDSGLGDAVADSVAQTLPATPAARAQWLAGRDRWHQSVLAPFLARVRARLHVVAEPDSGVAERMALLLAARAATVRWPPDAGYELEVRNDPDIRAAVGYFPRLAELLSGPK
ncbi:MAG TPA: S41 family peptidase [Gemmatimonadales bacterium]|nr:S41 family peptidase [Gemmatimonadales bacterium]